MGNFHHLQWRWSTSVSLVSEKMFVKIFDFLIYRHRQQKCSNNQSPINRASARALLCWRQTFRGKCNWGKCPSDEMSSGKYMRGKSLRWKCPRGKFPKFEFQINLSKNDWISSTDSVCCYIWLITFHFCFLCLSVWPVSIINKKQLVELLCIFQILTKYFPRNFPNIDPSALSHPLHGCYSADN